MVKEKVTPDDLKELINFIMTQEITKCEERQASQNIDSKKFTKLQGAIEVLTSLNEEVGVAIDQLNLKKN